MWISHMDSEVNRFHPVCEKALNAALIKLSKATEYEVLHHAYTGSLEMDFVIQNKRTKNYLCVVEVKRTPSDVNSARYQYQAMSYVQMNVPISEKPFYVLTNLEYAFAFRYDPARPRVFQQMLEPGLRHIGDFSTLSQTAFEEKLTDAFVEMISNFLSNSYSYLVTLEQFENHMRNITNSTAKWKSSLIVLLYEYIRGAFISIGRPDLPYDVRVFRNNVERICAEAANVNFKEIFSYMPNKLEKTASITNDILTNIFDFGKQSISGDSIAGLLHSIISFGMEHEGVVSTDLELARVVALLAKSLNGNIKSDECICDPAAGSGNLISSAIEIFNVAPKQIKANDINERLLELLSLRIGLNFAKIVSNENTAEISAKSIADLPSDYFENVAVVVMNPPFVAGINCAARKQELFRKIRDIRQKNAMTNIGQMNLEGAFLETICSMCKPNTVISCVLPKTHLVARGKEAVALRRYLLSDFGLTAIFSYPEEGLFEDVVKGTCVVVGRIGTPSNSIKIISSVDLVADIDLHAFENAVGRDFNTGGFASIVPGIEGLSQSREHLLLTINEGWRQICREFDYAIEFQKQYIEPNEKLIIMSDIPKNELIRKRGVAGNSGASDLLMIDRNKSLYKVFQEKPTIPAMRNAKYDNMFVAEGDTVCFDAMRITDSDLDYIVSSYMSLPVKEGQQQKKEKSHAELKDLIVSTSKKSTPANSVLIPRGIRSKGKVYVTEKKTVISTNLISVSLNNNESALILASWFSTIFFQLICEINAKPQEGMRKMEVGDIEATYIPRPDILTDEQKSSIISETKNIEFLPLNNPIIRNIDKLWAGILFAEDADIRLSEAKRLLEFLANTRNPLSLADE
jgi:Type I restriction-modification system methyltransferase subunit